MTLGKPFMILNEHGEQTSAIYHGKAKELQKYLKIVDGNKYYNDISGDEGSV
jgi:hypothetical protein